MPVVSHTRELRQVLAQTIEQVRSGDVSANDAIAVSKLAHSIIQAARFDLELYRAAHELGPLPLEPIIGDATETPQQLSIGHVQTLDMIRERVCEALAEAGPMPSKLISQKLSIPKKKLAEVLDHEWFEETPEGYRIAQA